MAQPYVVRSSIAACARFALFFPENKLTIMLCYILIFKDCAKEVILEVFTFYLFVSFFLYNVYNILLNCLTEKMTQQ